MHLLIHRHNKPAYLGKGSLEINVDEMRVRANNSSRDERSQRATKKTLETLSQLFMNFLFQFFVDDIPNGGQTIPKGGSLPRQSWKNPTYHGMYQS